MDVKELLNRYNDIKQKRPNQQRLKYWTQTSQLSENQQNIQQTEIKTQIEQQQVQQQNVQESKQQNQMSDVNNLLQKADQLTLNLSQNNQQNLSQDISINKQQSTYQLTSKNSQNLQSNQQQNKIQTSNNENSYSYQHTLNKQPENQYQEHNTQIQQQQFPQELINQSIQTSQQQLFNTSQVYQPPSDNSVIECVCIILLGCQTTQYIQYNQDKLIIDSQCTPLQQTLIEQILQPVIQYIKPFNFYVNNMQISNSGSYNVFYNNNNKQNINDDIATQNIIKSSQQSIQMSLTHHKVAFTLNQIFQRNLSEICDKMTISSTFQQFYTKILKNLQIFNQIFDVFNEIQNQNDEIKLIELLCQLRGQNYVADNIFNVIVDQILNVQIKSFILYQEGLLFKKIFTFQNEVKMYIYENHNFSLLQFSGNKIAEIASLMSKLTDKQKQNLNQIQKIKFEVKILNFKNPLQFDCKIDLIYSLLMKLIYELNEQNIKQELKLFLDSYWIQSSYMAEFISNITSLQVYNQQSIINQFESINQLQQYQIQITRENTEFIDEFQIVLYHKEAQENNYFVNNVLTDELQNHANKIFQNLIDLSRIDYKLNTSAQQIRFLQRKNDIDQYLILGWKIANKMILQLNYINSNIQCILRNARNELLNLQAYTVIEMQEKIINKFSEIDQQIQNIIDKFKPQLTNIKAFTQFAMQTTYQEIVQMYMKLKTLYNVFQQFAIKFD